MVLPRNIRNMSAMKKMTPWTIAGLTIAAARTIHTDDRASTDAMMWGDAVCHALHDTVLSYGCNMKKGSDRHGGRRRKNSSARTTIYQIHIINIA